MPRNSSVGVILCGLIGCQPADVALPTPERVGEHVRFWTDREDVVCAGSLPYVDAYAGQLATLHGVDDVLVDYYFVDPESELLEQVCHEVAPWASGCTKGSTVITTVLPHEHELVHAVRGEFGLSHLFFEEGAAEVWGQASDRSYDEIAGVNIRAALASTTSPLPGELMPVAGLFAAFLVDSHGPQVLVDLARETEPSSTIDEIEVAFATAAGAPLSEEISTFESEGWDCGRSLYRDDSVECAVAPPIDCSLADETGSVTVFLDLECDAQTVVGPRDGLVWTAVAFEQPTWTNLMVSTESSSGDASGIEVSFIGCRAGCSDNIFTIPVDTELELMLPDGQYLLRATRPLEGGGAGGVAVTLHGLCT